MTARSKKVINYAALGGGDSDDDFSSPQSPILQPKKKSKLSKKKSENSKKVYTSTQLEEANPTLGRGGRPARRLADEVQFEKEIQDALKMSVTDTESSGEIILKNAKDNPQCVLGASSAETLLLDQENIPITESDNNPGDFASLGTDIKATFNDKVNNDDSDDDFTPARTIKKAAVIESDDDDLEDKPSNKESKLAVPKLHIKKIGKTTVASAGNKKRKIDDGWVVSANKKKATNLIRDVKPLEGSDDEFEESIRKSKPPPKPLEESDDEFEESIRKSKPPPKTIPAIESKNKATVNLRDKITDLKESERSASEESEDEFDPGPKQKISNTKKRIANIKQTKYDGTSDFEESSNSEDSDDDFDPEENTKKKTPTKKSVKKTPPAKTTPTVKIKKTTPTQIEKLTSPPVSRSPVKSFDSPVKSTKSPVKPLGLHNIPQNKSTAVTPVLSSLKLARTPSSLSRIPLPFSGPKLAKTASNHLNRVGSSVLQASSPLSVKPLQTSSSMGAKPKLGGAKIPSWTPPARVGQASLNSGLCASPSLGLRVGLSRNMKVSKPLHSNVKHQ